MRQAGNTRLADHGESLNRANATTTFGHRYEIGWTPLLVSLDRSAPNDLVPSSARQQVVGHLLHQPPAGERIPYEIGDGGPWTPVPISTYHRFSILI